MSDKFRSQHLSIPFEEILESPRPAYSANRIDAGTVPRIINFRGTIMIKKVKAGYKVLSEKGKNLGGPYKTRQEAAKRLRQVEYFKHRKG
jgi:hypothetical protein